MDVKKAFTQLNNSGTFGLLISGANASDTI